MPNRAHCWDLRTPTAPIARLPVSGITGLSALNADTDAAAITLLAAVGGSVLCFDTRMLPKEDPIARKPPPRLATLETLDSAVAGRRLTCVDAVGTRVVAGDSEGGLHFWDVGECESEFT